MPAVHPCRSFPPSQAIRSTPATPIHYIAAALPRCPGAPTSHAATRLPHHACPTATTCPTGPSMPAASYHPSPPAPSNRPCPTSPRRPRRSTPLLWAYPSNPANPCAPHTRPRLAFHTRPVLPTSPSLPCPFRQCPPPIPSHQSAQSTPANLDNLTPHARPSRQALPARPVLTRPGSRHSSPFPMPCAPVASRPSGPPRIPARAP